MPLPQRKALVVGHSTPLGKRSIVQQKEPRISYIKRFSEPRQIQNMKDISEMFVAFSDCNRCFSPDKAFIFVWSYYFRVAKLTTAIRFICLSRDLCWIFRVWTWLRAKKLIKLSQSLLRLWTWCLWQFVCDKQSNYFS